MVDEPPQNVDATNNEKDKASTMEINLRLDSNGRTTYDPALLAATKTGADAGDGDSAHNPKRAKIDPDNNATATASSLDYSSKTKLTNLAALDSSLEKEMNDLLFDCEITDCGLLPRTFWVPASDTAGTEPRCFLEKLALEIFHHHVPPNNNSTGSDNDFYYDPETSGAEWWVQIRPSPPTGRYSMLASDDDGDDDMAKSGISFHWDKDEDLRLMCGGSMYIHPHISTVTYLSQLGAPTCVLTKRVDPMTGEYVHETNNDGSPSAVEGYVSWPKRGKHLSFDGGLLHAAPMDLMENGKWEKQCKYTVTSEMDERTKKILARKHRRVTFLVNIWLNYKPFNVNPFPETMIGNMSKPDLFGDFSLFHGESNDSEKKCDEEESDTKTVIVCDGKASSLSKTGSADNVTKKCNTDNLVKVNKMKWSMGQKEEESIEILMPLELIREQAETGSDVAITWNDGVVLVGTGA